MDKGLIHIYCGDGKGKTTAALGLSLRAAGCGFKVYIIQFLKNWETGEIVALGNLDKVTIMRGNIPSKLTWQLNDDEKLELKNEHNRLLKEGISRLQGDCSQTLLVLDEVIGAYGYNLIDRQILLDFLKSKPPMLEVVMTGRNPAVELTDLADYVSEIKKIKHPYDKGIKARRGIER